MRAAAADLASDLFKFRDAILETVAMITRLVDLNLSDQRDTFLLRRSRGFLYCLACMICKPNRSISLDVGLILLMLSMAGRPLRVVES